MEANMFCYQCQETAKNTGCTMRGVCGKTDDVSNLQDLLLYLLKGIGIVATIAREKGIVEPKVNRFVVDGLFATITNANFDHDYFVEKISTGLKLRDELKGKLSQAGGSLPTDLFEAVTWAPSGAGDYEGKARQVGYLSIANEDIRSLRATIIFGLKGMAAYTEHAMNLGFDDAEIHAFIQKALAQVTDDSLGGEELTALVVATGTAGVSAMALLDKANTSTYGHPEITSVEIGVRQNPGILISGHDLRDLEDLLEQTAGTGVDVYTHSEMLPAHYYPFFKKYTNFAGNYGNAWWQQDKEFASFNGPILMTTNCIVPVKDAYKDRLYTTNAAGWPGAPHIGERPVGGRKDFGQIIQQAKACPPPTEIETGTIVGGFAHNQVFALADKVVEAVKSGAIKKFFVMAGCDGRMKSREYYTEFAKVLPADTVILTAGCAKYRYNKLALGDIGGIPRVLDAGQCNDSYSLAVVALKLKEIFGAADVNDLPIEFNIAWYEQKAVIVLLALLSLGFKNIRLGPTLPGFLTPGVAKVIIDAFGLKGITTVQEDMADHLK
jgi:hydroxylamine reductase